jgi:hypothetical protein
MATIASPPVALERIIDEATHRVAAERQLDPAEVRRSRVCRFMSTELVLGLIDNGVQHVRTDSRAGRAIDEHRYVVINPDTPDETLVDATWQQFLPAHVDATNLPRALVGSREEVVSQAAAAGIAEADLAMWEPATAETMARHLTPQERVAQAIDERMSAEL